MPALKKRAKINHLAPDWITWKACSHWLHKLQTSSTIHLPPTHAGIAH